MNAKAMLCRSLIDTSLGTCCVLVRSKSEHGTWKSIGKQKEAMKKRHKMCWFEFLEPKNKNHNNQPQIRIGKPFAVVVACWKWPSMAIVASKKERRLSLAFVRVGGRTWLKMSYSPMGKFGSSGEHFHFLSVATSSYVVQIPMVNRKTMALMMMHDAPNLASGVACEAAAMRRVEPRRIQQFFFTSSAAT